MRERFTGVTTALATPFTADGRAVDEAAFAALARRQVEEGVDALLVASLAGEGSTLSVKKRERLIALAVEVAAGRVPVIAATGSNATDATIASTRRARELGADAALLVVPYYNKPSQDGLVRHVEAIARAVELPLILENAPSHCGIGMAHPTLMRLTKIPSIIGLADGSGDLAVPARLPRIVDRPFLCLTTRDADTLPFLTAGGHGAVSVVANVAPRTCVALRRACRESDVDRQRAVAAYLAPLVALIGSEGAPAAVKYALSLVRSDIQAAVRLPMVPLGQTTAETLAATLASFADFDGLLRPPNRLTRERSGDASATT